ncbi:rhomboid family intramembrane serine protease [Parasphingorhabdus sp.]|uniref:rhomboid family intramembrane serine protease n=1 Tax=Parasphingorhabdus sp. TaxID=2709688 RepID=UPI0032668BDC
MNIPNLTERLKVIAILCGLFVAVHFANLLSGGYLNNYGIEPREIDSIYTIFVAPWLHGDLTHLGNNMLAIVVFSFLCLLNGRRYFVIASFMIIAITGILVWLFARDALHIGASGWIFGLWSLTIALGWIERSFRNIVVALGVVFFYGGMVFGVLPTAGFVSFESHLFGAIAGILTAIFLERNRNLVTATNAPRPSLEFGKSRHPWRFLIRRSKHR